MPRVQGCTGADLPKGEGVRIITSAMSRWRTPTKADVSQYFRQRGVGPLLLEGQEKIGFIATGLLCSLYR